MLLSEIKKLIDMHTEIEFGNKGEKVKVLQNALHFLAYDLELNWSKYGADGIYGNSTKNALTAFCNSISFSANGEKVTNELLIKIYEACKIKIDNENSIRVDSDNSKTSNYEINEVLENGRERVYVSDSENRVRFTKFKKGIYYSGKVKTKEFIDENKSILISNGMTESALNIIISVSENEGNLDAINTWDNSFLTFGMFQWTIGAGSDPGELVALLKKVFNKNKDIYNKYFGCFGLEIFSANSFNGYLKLNNEKIETTSQKEKLRNVEWAFRFWKAGQDLLIQSVELEHAFSRINLFYNSPNYKVQNHFISEIIKSEYGVALLLDNHVNRPGYICGCLEKAIEESGINKSFDLWTTEDEKQILDLYLTIRNTYGKYPMTDAMKRATTTKRYLEKKIISDERGSFKV